MDRRTFLLASLLSSFEYLLHQPKLALANQKSGPRIIIIGAGMAGISAGRYLSDCGYQVALLETRNRIGGRIIGSEDDGGFNGRDLLFPIGYDQIINALALGLDIRIGDPVRRIDIRPKEVRILTEGCSVYGDAVICTLPPGVLKACYKAGSIEFYPGLPDWKKKAIDSLEISDEPSVGSCSRLAVGSSGEIFDLMAKPVGSRMYFAGDATTRRHPGTVHGAFLSGQRAAVEAMRRMSLPGSRCVKNTLKAGR